MSYFLTTRWGGDEREASLERMREVLNELDAEDPEHPCVSLTHESEWSLGAFQGGALVWENLEDGEPRHMADVSRERVLELWQALASGRLKMIEAESWLPGYPG